MDGEAEKKKERERERLTRRSKKKTGIRHVAPYPSPHHNVVNPGVSVILDVPKMVTRDQKCGWGGRKSIRI
jgi:hypothetical protein